MTDTFLKLVRHRRSGKVFLALSRKLPWKGNDLAWFRPMKFLWFKWEKVYNKKDIEVVESPSAYEIIRAGRDAGIEFPYNCEVYK